MASLTRKSQNVSRLQQFRSWGGILLMLFSLSGGYRTATTFVEEIETEPTIEFVEYAHRLTDAGPRTVNRRGCGDFGMIAVTADGSTSRPTTQRAGSTDRTSHVLANGLRAPLRC
jgi:hypothetical protein